MLEDEIDANTVIIHSGVRLLDAARTLCFQTVTLWRVEIEFAAMFAVAEITILRRHGLGSEPIDIGAESRLCFNSNLSIEGEIQQINRDPACLRLNIITQTEIVHIYFAIPLQMSIGFL